MSIASDFFLCLQLRDNIGNVLLTAALESKDPRRHVNIPVGFTANELQSIDVIIQIMEPFADLTDEMQSDDVTSCVVLVGLLNAVQSKRQPYS